MNKRGQDKSDETERAKMFVTVFNEPFRVRNNGSRNQTVAMAK
jgi:hypothetical protein